MQQTLPWIIALVAVALLVPMVALLMRREPKPKAKPLPTECSLSARPVYDPSAVALERAGDFSARSLARRLASIFDRVAA